MEPKEIPQGFHITQHEKLQGLRKFKVVKDGAADTYHIVYVGTIMVQNGFAYIAGDTLFLEEPPCYLKAVWFPPFAVSYPLKCPAGMTERDFVAQVMEQHRGKLIESIEASGNDTTKPGMLDFDLTKKLVLYPPHPTCTTCHTKLLRDFESTCCPVCDDPERGQVDHKTEEAVQEMKAKIKKMEARLNDKEVEIEAARAQVEKSNRKAALVAEQLQAAQAKIAVMEAELRELRAAHADLDDDILKKRRRMSGIEEDAAV